MTIKASMGISFARKPKQMLGNGVYVSTSCKFWSYSGLLELIKQVLKKFTLKKLTYGRT